MRDKMSGNSKQPNGSSYSPDRPILYIMVVGFHHKKGCQLEYVYPNDTRIARLSEESSDSSSDLYKLPKKWKHLPSLALPDGSHNYDTDYIYFHLEDDEVPTKPADKPTSASNQTQPILKPNRTVFGVSCYRQINASEMLIKDVDVTRNTLQKSVCILTRMPIYSSLRVKLHTITQAYFEQKDFHRVELLVNAFDSILQQTSSFESSLLSNQQDIVKHHRLLLNQEDKSKYFIGLSLGDLVLRYQHKILILFKLMLLQKKCLFQIKPVSNLSNTIVSLVSLIPDIFLPVSKQQSGLDYCAGFFDSIDLVNCELEQKSLAKKRKLKLIATSVNDVTNESNKKSKKLKKKLKSFSKKHGNHANNNNGVLAASAGNGSSLTLSHSMHSIKDAQQQQTEDAKSGSNILNAFTSNTQRLFSFKSSSQAVNRSDLDLDLSTNSGKGGDDNRLLAGTPPAAFHDQKAKLNLKSNVFSSKQSNSSSSSSSLSNKAHGQNLAEDETVDEIKREFNNAPIADILKTNVMKLVDWSSPSPTPLQQMHDRIKSDDDSIVIVEDKPIPIVTEEANTSVVKPTSRRKLLSEQSNDAMASQINEIQFNDLLDIDFGAPFNIFNEFNILHPYLSLYYLDYFSGINKMNTKLYCTTTLMMSMMKDNKENGGTELAEDEVDVEESGASSGNLPIKSSATEPESTNIGYTIGATNILFKQRLYDDLDAFIDELDIDLRGNETLKKQLQLTTADLRFIDFITKNVQAARNDKHSQQQSNQANTTPTLLSFKKIISTNNLDRATGQPVTPTSTERSFSGSVTSTPSDSNGHAGHAGLVWEGSDDWIRINFKWYIFSLLGCMVKEDLANSMRAEMESILFNNSELTSTLNGLSSKSSSSSGESNSSHNSSTLSLNNNNNPTSTNTNGAGGGEVVNIDDYIDKVTNNSYNSSTENPTATASNKANSNINILSTISNQYFYCLEELNSHMDYRDDFNSNYINELRKTNWFKVWFDVNRARVEKSLFKYDSELIKSQVLSAIEASNSSTPVNNLSQRFGVLFAKYQELNSTRLNHPFSGQISMGDLRLKFNVLFNGTESGRKLNKAFAEGGKLVNNTSKAVGDALSHAKSTFSSLFNSWSTNKS